MDGRKEEDRMKERDLRYGGRLDVQLEASPPGLLVVTVKHIPGLS